MSYSQILITLTLLPLIACNATVDKKQAVKVEENERALMDSSAVARTEQSSNVPIPIDTLEVIVVQCANGYEYATHQYDFNPVIEHELNTFENIKVKPFPYKTLMGVAYQGVFDKKYCPPIIEKVDVDFLILTRFDKRFDAVNSTEMKWGYELRVVNTETLEQINSINAHGLKDYEAIEQHIKENIKTLKADLEKVK